MGCSSSQEVVKNVHQSNISLQDTGNSNSHGLTAVNNKPILIHLSPALSAVGEDGTGRPARVEVNDHSVERRKTGEEPIYEMSEDEEFGHGKLGLLLTREEIDKILSGLDLENGQYFEDPEFPATEAALFYSTRPQEELNQYTWKRPYELAPSGEPKLYIDGTSRRDVIQGILGDCWLLSTCAAIAKREDLMYRVISQDQVLYGEGYTGLIEVRVWRYGHWVSVFVDDRLPQKQGHYCYAHSADPNEFWVAMIEKAFAKLHGSYEAIEGGMPIEAMVDMTGGLAERYELKHEEHAQTLYRYLRRSFAAQAFITCSRKGNWRGAHKAEKNGLVQGHAYTITGIYRVDLKPVPDVRHKKVHLIRVRNPWGDSNEWKGEWCDGHANWNLVSKSTKRDMGLHHQYDGEFWMDFFKDFCREFEEVSICTLGPDFNHDGTVDLPETVKVTFGQWIPTESAGGCRNNLKLFATNPQFHLRVHEADDTHIPMKVLEKDSSKDSANFSFEEEEPDPQKPEKVEHNLKDPKCQVIISLSQEYRRSERDRKVKLFQIGFCLYRAAPIPSSGEASQGSVSRLEEKFFAYNYDVGSSGPYINYREVVGRFELSPGDYIIIPATFEPNSASRFMMRVYAGKKIDLKHV